MTSHARDHPPPSASVIALVKTGDAP